MDAASSHQSRRYTSILFTVLHACRVGVSRNFLKIKLNASLLHSFYFPSEAGFRLAKVPSEAVTATGQIVKWQELETLVVHHGQKRPILIITWGQPARRVRSYNLGVRVSSFAAVAMHRILSFGPDFMFYEVRPRTRRGGASRTTVLEPLLEVIAGYKSFSLSMAEQAGATALDDNLNALRSVFGLPRLQFSDEASLVDKRTTWSQTLGSLHCSSPPTEILTAPALGVVPACPCPSSAFSSSSSSFASRSPSLSESLSSGSVLFLRQVSVKSGEIELTTY